MRESLVLWAGIVCVLLAVPAAAVVWMLGREYDDALWWSALLGALSAAVAAAFLTAGVELLLEVCGG